MVGAGGDSDADEDQMKRIKYIINGRVSPTDHIVSVYMLCRGLFVVAINSEGHITTEMHIYSGMKDRLTTGGSQDRLKVGDFG